MSRLQGFVVIGLLILMLGGLVTLVRNMKDSTVDELPSGTVHGIETYWQSACGTHRLWSTTKLTGNYREWVDEHVAAFTVAQHVLTPIDKR